MRRPRHDAVRGLLYSCEWLQDPIIGDYPGHDPRPIVTSRTRALWVPDAGLLFQWPLPRGTVQVTEPREFPPPHDQARVSLLGDRTVPYPVIREARRYLERQEHIQALEATLQKAIDRVTDAAVRSEGRLQSALTEAGIRP